MKKYLQKILLVLVLVLVVTACGKSRASLVIGIWEYQAVGYTVTYEFKPDGTGTYKLSVGRENSNKNLTYQIKAKEKKILITFENDKDAFESDFKVVDKNTLSITDSFGEEYLYKRVREDK